MKQTTARHFEIFKNEAQRLVEKFGLIDWNVTYSHATVLQGKIATTSTNYMGRSARIALATDWDATCVQPTAAYLKQVAKHEAIHLLLANFNSLAGDRYSSADELDHCLESLVVKLEHLIT